MKVRILQVPKAQMGMELIPMQNPLAEVEAGEVMHMEDGSIEKVPDHAPTHEEGGVLVSDASRILEDTSDKRADKDSKELLLDPEDIQELTGFKAKKAMTHSKAFEKSAEYWDKELKKLERKLKGNMDFVDKTNSKYAKNSLEENLKMMDKIPTKMDLFNNLFSHQEHEKEEYNIPTGEFATGGSTYPNQPNDFYEPLRWFDVAGPISNYVDAMSRIPVRTDMVNLQYSPVKYMDPSAQLAAGQESYNAMLNMLPQNAVGNANAANLFRAKYSMDNQVLGQAENINNQLYNTQAKYVDQILNQQQQADFAARQQAEQKYLTSLENQRKQKALSLGDISDTIAKNKKLNREGDLIMSMINYYNQFGEKNANKYDFVQKMNSNVKGSLTPIKAGLFKDESGNLFKTDKDNNLIKINK